LDQLVALVAPLMADAFVERPAEVLACRNEDDDSPAGLQELIRAPQCRDVAGRVLQHAAARAGVDAVSRKLDGVVAAGIGALVVSSNRPYFRIVQMALKPSFQLIFFPSQYSRP